jgi:DNA ligase (NAD+)
MVRDRQLGPGALIEIIRSGEVIPKLVGVRETSNQVELPTTCPSCDEALSWREDFLRCTNVQGCSGQVVHRIRHWFWTLGNADGMGIKTLQRIVDAGHTSLEQVYALKEADFLGMEFGPGQTKVLLKALEDSRSQAVEDARFLAALGIADLGMGESRRLLGRIKLSELGALDVETLLAIKGFGPITSTRIVEGLQARWPEVEHLLSLGFNLDQTPVEAEREAVDSPIAGLKVVFTGSMQQGNREDMKAQARALGAQVQASISQKTDLLVVGEKAGSKLNKAEAIGVRVLTEEAYIAFLES